MELEEDSYIFYIQVKSTGKFAGKEVIQIYVNAPRGKLGKPLRSLISFAKTRCLKPEEVQEIKVINYPMSITKRFLWKNLYLNLMKKIYVVSFVERECVLLK